jgi:hypothetical protein
MSMRVFYAYLFKENAEFKDLYEARKYLNDLRKKKSDKGIELYRENLKY